MCVCCFTHLFSYTIHVRCTTAKMQRDHASLSVLYSCRGWSASGKLSVRQMFQGVYHHFQTSIRPFFSKVASSNVQAGLLSSKLQRLRVSATSCTNSLNSADLQLPVGIPIDNHKMTGSHQLVPGTWTTQWARKYPQINIRPPRTAVDGTLMALPISLQPYTWKVADIIVQHEIASQSDTTTQHIILNACSQAHLQLRVKLIA